MPRWVTAFLGLFVLAVVAGLFLMFIVKMRADAALVSCQNNLRELAMFAGQFANPTEDGTFTSEVPPGTILNPALRPDERLSWYVDALPWFNQQRANTAELSAAIDRKMAWNAAPNITPSHAKLPFLFCPGLPPEYDPTQPAPTNYFGVAGLNPDAAGLPLDRITLKLGAFGTWPMWKVSPRAGCFRYNAPTPFTAITDGLSETILFGEREPATGPWIRGGPSTVRGIDTGPNALPRIGPGAQFGGGHNSVANFAFADGSVKFISQNIDPKVLDARATIAGGEREAAMIAE